MECSIWVHLQQWCVNTSHWKEHSHKHEQRQFKLSLIIFWNRIKALFILSGNAAYKSSQGFFFCLFFCFPPSPQLCFWKVVFSPMGSHTYSVRRFDLVNGIQVRLCLGCAYVFGNGCLFVYSLCKKGPDLKQRKSFHSKIQKNPNSAILWETSVLGERERERDGKGRQLLEPLCQPSAALNHLNEGWRNIGGKDE